MAGRDPLTGRTLGEFVLREQIGEGGFGAVYRCEQPLLGREAVIKVLHHRLRASEVVRQRFMREAQLASRLDHPYAAHVYAFGVERDDGLCWIAMEMVQGTALDTWLRERGPLRIEQLVPFLERVAEVVQTAHERGIVHRDLKPSNIMVIERAGRLLPKLLDFGIAKVFDPEASARPRTTQPARPAVAMAPTVVDTDGDTDVPAGDKTPRETPRRPADPAPEPVVPRTPETDPLTRADAAIGSPPYMAPEQWTDATRVGPSADLYSLAIVAYEALAGHRPFVAATAAALADLHCNAPVPPLGEAFAPALDRFFARALAKRPEDRPATSLELVAMLRVAAGIGGAPEDLPRLDEGVREVWLAEAPQSLAETVATLDAARSVHQARDAARDLLRGLVRYLCTLALAARAQVRGERDDPALRELLRAVRRRDLDDDERHRLLRLLVQPFEARRGAYPIPELVDLIARPDDPLDAALRVRPSSEQAGSEDVVRSQLAQFMPGLVRLLRATAFVLDYALVVPREHAPERWMGLRRPRRALAVVRDLALADDQPALLDRDGRPALVLWPLVQALSPTVGAERELFAFDGRGRRGARFVAAPAGFEHDDAALWDWYGEHVLGELESESLTSADDRPPYLGLASFTASDADRFVGREREIEAFVNRLRKEPLLIVVGPSGAGKSSFVHAGVVPNLPAGWRAITLRPGAAPVATLTAKLATGNGMRVVIVDQLEELFTLVPSADERAAFAAQLAQLAADVDAPSRVICTVRDDFLMSVESLAALRPLVSRALVLLGNPSRDDLVRTIVEPARRSGYALSDAELARDMVEVVADRSGALALLSFTASRLWELRDRRFRQLTRKAYDAMGGVAGALGRHAEETFIALTAEDQRIAREAFRHLVTTENTRAVLSIAELRQRLASPHADVVIDRLVAARLLAVVEGDGEPHVELVHEALIAAWPRLEQWTREDLADTRTREQVRAAAKQWADRDRARELLWRGELLAELRAVRGRARLTDLELAFADASVREAARRRRTTQMVAGSAIAVLFAGVVGLLLLTARLANQRDRADAAAATLHDNLERQFENQGRRLVLDGSPLEALAYLARAEELGAHGPIHDFLFAQAVQASDGEIFEVHHDAGVVAVRFSHDGALLASETFDRMVHLWDARSGTLLRTLPRRTHVNGHGIAFVFSPDDTSVLTAADGGVAILWSTTTGAELRRFAQSGSLGCLRFSVDGALVVTGDESGEIAVWDAATGARRLTLPSDGTAIVGCDIARTRIAARDGKGTTRVWDLATGARVGELRGIYGDRGTVVLSPDAGSALTIDGAKITEWDVASGRMLHELVHDGRIYAAEWSSDGARIATASDDHTAAIWDARTGTRLRVIAGHTASVRRATFSPTGTQLVTVGEDASVLLWNAATGERVARWLGHTGVVYDVDFTADGRRVATAGDDGRVIVWRAEPQQRIAALRGHTRYIEAAKFSPDGSRVVTSSGDGTARVWSARTGESLAVFAMHGGEVLDAAFSHDGRWVATAGESGALQVWDAKTNALAATLDAGHGPVFQLAWGADDATLAAVDADGSTRGWTVPTRAPRFTIRGRANTVSSIDFAPDGHAVLTTSSDDVIRAWNLDGELVAAFPSPEHPYTAVFDPSGTRLLGAVRGGAAIWRFPSGLRERELVGHVGFVSSVAWSPDGATAITAASDGTARIWEASSGDELAILRPPGRARTAAFSPDGTRIVIGNDDGTVAIYDLPRNVPSGSERAALLACRVPYVVAGDRLASRTRSCPSGVSQGSSR